MINFIKPQILLVVLFWTMIIGIIFSPFVLSLSHISIFLASIFLVRESNWRKPNISEYLANLKEHRLFWGYLLIFAICFIDFVITYPVSDFSLARIRIKLPFLLLPLAFANLPSLSKKEIFYFFLGFLLIMSIANFGIILNYLQEFTGSQLELKQGRSIETPRNHIRHSLLTAISFLVGLKYYNQNHPNIKGLHILFFLSIFNFIALHVIAVRSGLIIGYLFLFCFIVYQVFQEKKYLIGGIAFSVLFSLPFFAYQLVPSFQKKIEYSLYDWNQSKQGNAEIYSDGQRIISYQIGLRLFNENPIIGNRIGNIDKKVSTIYNKEHPKSVIKYPHNQYLFWLVGFGLPITVVVLSFLFWPLLLVKKQFYFFFITFKIGILISCLVENTFETAMGVAIFIFFACFLLRYEPEIEWV